MPSEDAVIDAVPKQLFIGGQWRDASSGKTLTVEDPATGLALCEVADASPEDSLAALAAADDAAADWARTPPRERGEILRRAYQALVDRQDELALLMTLEMGKRPPGTFRRRWARARSARRSRPAARWSSNPPNRLP
jgi:succinate-semialdehyde dehydrogenase / glutarate-semialdehyde dehydrogenase